MSERLEKLSEQLRRAADARAMLTSPIWAESWATLEAELIDRFTSLEPGDDLPRYRLQEAILTARRLRRLVESAGGASVAQIEKEIDLIEGRAMRPIA